MTDETTRTKKAGLSPIEVGAGAGAAVITAFASSYLGTAGTLTGAAIASVVGTVSTSVLRNSAKTSAERVKQTTTRLRDTRVEHVRATDVRPVESEDVDPYGTQLFGAPYWIDPEPRAGSGRTERLGPAGATGADPASTWEAPTQRHTGAGPDETRVSGSPAGRRYGPGAPGPTSRATDPGAISPAIGAARPGTGPAAGAGGPGSGAAAGAGGPETGATRPAPGQTGPGVSGTGRSGTPPERRRGCGGCVVGGS